MALGTNIDLDRVIFDPEYRRSVIEALNQGASARRAGVERMDTGPMAAAARTAQQARSKEMQ